MNKKLFSILVILMSLSLIGIIFVQAYYINNILKNKEQEDIIIITLLSLVFTMIIIIGYMSAVYQLIQQRKISQMKSDFINNMTHEFKTPIATINLALDAIKNPKIFNNKAKVWDYISMIKEENKRMNAQVENVLRISKLQKKQLIISKDRLQLHELIEDAITHVELIVKNRAGYIKTNFKATKASILANDSYFTNVIVNILDNAIKYSEGPPKIDITTENHGNSILMSIKDQGVGIGKVAQKRVFEEFFIETEFTARMEADLDEVASGNKNYEEVLNAFWAELQNYLNRKINDIEISNKDEFKTRQVLDLLNEELGSVIFPKDESGQNRNECPKCSSPISLKSGAWGYFVGCSECKWTKKPFEFNTTWETYQELPKDLGVHPDLGKPITVLHNFDK